MENTPRMERPGSGAMWWHAPSTPKWKRTAIPTFCWISPRTCRPKRSRRAFPILRRCLRVGVNITRGPIRWCRPAHYLLAGGVAVDEWGRTSIRNLYAVGEVSCTGLHGPTGWLPHRCWRGWCGASAPRRYRMPAFWQWTVGFRGWAALRRSPVTAPGPRTCDHPDVGCWHSRMGRGRSSILGRWPSSRPACADRAICRKLAFDIGGGALAPHQPLQQRCGSQPVGPCRPVQLTSPTAYRLRMLVRPIRRLPRRRRVMRAPAPPRMGSRVISRPPAGTRRKYWERRVLISLGGMCEAISSQNEE